MRSLEYTLETLSKMFTARDIMTEIGDLVCAHGEAEARKILNDHSEFDVIPIYKATLTSFLERGSKRARPITIKDLVSETISMLDIVDVLADRKFCFVLGNRSICGMIHFSDLNNHVVKIPFFVLFEALEQQLIKEMVSLIDRDTIKIVFGQKRFEEIDREMLRLRRNRADLHWVNLISLRGILRCARHYNKVSLSPDEIKTISDVRNLVTHATRPLAEKHDDIRQLAAAKRICMETMRSLG